LEEECVEASTQREHQMQTPLWLPLLEMLPSNSHSAKTKEKKRKKNKDIVLISVLHSIGSSLSPSFLPSFHLLRTLR
jgi:hypothetical protein